LGHLTGDLTNELGSGLGLLDEIIDIEKVVESGLEDLEEIVSGLPEGSLLVKLIESLLALLKKELGELEGSGLGSGLGSHGLGSHGSNENNNVKRTRGQNGH
jgi:hypothetical protein